jgi:hypothetical protein
MDAQQQVVALLESELQKSILGDSSTTVGSLLGVAGKVENIYAKAGVSEADQMGFNAGEAWLESMIEGTTGFSTKQAVDQDFLRQALYQARALLGELRIEEQAWNGEVNSEKTLRKEVNDFAKI